MLHETVGVWYSNDKGAGMSVREDSRPLRRVVALVVALGVVAGGVWVVYRAFRILMDAIAALPAEIAAAIIAGSASILGAALTIALGRYFERKRELDALYRDKKTQIYDEFLRRFFALYLSGEVPSDPESQEGVEMIREFMRSLILWGGPEVIQSFLRWKTHLSKAEPDAESIFLTEGFLLSLRKDLGHQNTGIPRGFFAHLFLSHGELFLALAAKKPGITLAEVAEIERQVKAGKNL